MIVGRPFDCTVFYSLAFRMEIVIPVSFFIGKISSQKTLKMSSIFSDI